MQISLWEEHIRTILALLSVVLTALTIAVALLLQWALVLHHRPKLSLSFSDVLGDEDIAPVQLDQRAELWVRLRVNAGAGKKTAHNVEVLLLRVWRPAGGKTSVVPSRQLSWADTPDERLALPSGTYRRVDVLKLFQNEGDPGGPTALRPALKHYPDSPIAVGRDLLSDQGKYTFDLAVTADEVEATRWQFSFVYNGGPACSMVDLMPQLSFPSKPQPIMR
jgi:hypothetical protein